MVPPAIARPLPSNVHLVVPEDQLAFLDSRSVNMPETTSALAVWRQIMAKPLPLLGLAFRIRDAISARFGVKRIGGGGSRKVAGPVQAGDKLDFFLVEYIDAQTLVLTERDKHLDVMTCVTVQDRTLTITSSVITHNLFGRVYMVPVGIAHKWIVQIMLNRLRRDLQADHGAVR